MKKYLLMLIAVMSFVGVINAQTAIQSPKFFDNMYLGGELGSTMPLDFNNQFPYNATFGIKLGKNFTPVVGANIEGKTWFGDNHFNNLKTFFKSTYVGLNGTLNLMRMFNGGVPNKFELSTETGLGWIHEFDKDNDFLGAKTGVALGFNFKAWQVYVEPAVYWNLGGEHNGEKIQFDKRDAQLALAAGLIYKFKCSNGTHDFKTYDIKKLNDEINELRSRGPVHDTVTVTKNQVIDNRVWVVYFAQNSYDLTDEDLDILDNVPVNGKDVEVIGYASPEGTKEYNQGLSEKRAETVALYLKKRGVNVKSYKGMGVKDNTSGRVVIIY